MASFYAVEDSILLSEVRNKELWAYPNDADMVTTLLEANSISDVVVNEITNDMTLDDILLDSPSRIAFVTPDRLVPTVKLLSLDGGYFLEDHEGVLSLNAIFTHLRDLKFPHNYLGQFQNTSRIILYQMLLYLRIISRCA